MKLKNLILLTQIPLITSLTVAQPNSSCPAVDSLLKAGKTAEALQIVQDLESSVKEKFISEFSALIPETVGQFTREKPFTGGGELPKELAATMKQMQSELATNVTYKAKGLPVIRAKYSSIAERRISDITCKSGSEFLQQPAEPPLQIQNRKAVVRDNQQFGIFATLCFEGGSVQVNSDSASKEQLIQFMNDIPESNLKKMEALLAPLAKAPS